MKKQNILKVPNRSVAPANKTTAGKVIFPKVKATAGDNSQEKIIKKA